MAQVLRIIDANANRAREAMRVMEEAARFVLDDGQLASQLKHLRHDLRAAMEQSPAVAGASHWRDTPGDVGVSIATDSERRRESVAEVVIAAGKRLGEALRAIEEYAKVLDNDAAAAPVLAGRVEAIRYRAYDLEQRLNRAMGSGRVKQWRLCVLISESLCGGGDWKAVAGAAVDGGADCIQLREKDLEAGTLLDRARWLVELCRPAGVSVIVNDRPDVAMLAGADGVHLGQTDLPCEAVRRLVGRQLIVGVSTSNLEQAKRAQRDGADYCGVGPMFPTTTKHKDVIVGPDYLREFIAWGGLPHLAIGGITPANVSQLAAAGGRGVAVSGCVCGSDDPAGICREIVQQLAAPQAV